MLKERSVTDTQRDSEERRPGKAPPSRLKKEEDRRPQGAECHVPGRTRRPAGLGRLGWGAS